MVMETKEDLKPNIRRDFQWEELKIRIDHYKYYLNIALQANAFFYVIAGAVLGFYLKGPNETLSNSHLEYLLLLPILIGTVLGGLFIYGALLQNEAANSIEAIRSDLNDSGLEIKGIPDIHFLQRLLVIFGCILLLASFSLIQIPSVRISTPTIDMDSFNIIANIIFCSSVFFTLIVVGIKIRKMRRSQPQTTR
jgi:hypothetical protein